MFLADIVTEIEDKELCPGDDIIDPSLYTYSTPTVVAEKPVETLESAEVVSNVQNSENVEVIEKVQEEQQPDTETNTEVLPEPGTETSDENAQSEDKPVEAPVEQAEVVQPEQPEIVPSSNPEVEPEPETLAPTTKEPTTTSVATTTPHRLIVGTPLDASTVLPVNEYTIDEQYDDYEDSQPLFDTPEAQQEALVQIKRSESFWAFMSCTVLVVGMLLFYRKSFQKYIQC